MICTAFGDLVRRELRTIGQARRAVLAADPAIGEKRQDIIESQDTLLNRLPDCHPMTAGFLSGQEIGRARRPCLHRKG